MQTKIQEKMTAYRGKENACGDRRYRGRKEGRKGGGREEGRENSFLALKKTKKSTDDP